jgi:two-component system nitrate/nitrite response regulator NarL
MTQVIRVVIVDDHAIVREGVRTVLDPASGYAIVGEGRSVADAIAASAELHPDVLVLDITMPDGSGLQAIAEVIERSPSTRILMLSVHENLEYVLESIRAGAHGYLRKDSAPAELRAAVRAIHNGELFLSPEISQQVAKSLRGNPARPEEPTPSALTPREREVLVSIAQGLANKEIAARLGISSRTVEAHRDSIARKLGIRTVAGLTRFCLKHGLLDG